MLLLYRLAPCWRRAWLLFAIVAFNLCLPAAAWAAPADTGPTVHGDTIPYLLVLLCLALGFILLCRSSSRSKEVRLDELDED
jgi:hypothetical protein